MSGNAAVGSNTSGPAMNGAGSVGNSIPSATTGTPVGASPFGGAMSLGGGGMNTDGGSMGQSGPFNGVQARPVGASQFGGAVASGPFNGVQEKPVMQGSPGGQGMKGGLGSQMPNSPYAMPAFSQPASSANASNTNAIYPSLTGGAWNQLTQLEGGPQYTPKPQFPGTMPGLLNTPNGSPGNTFGFNSNGRRYANPGMPIGMRR